MTRNLLPPRRKHVHRLPWWWRYVPSLRFPWGMRVVRGPHLDPSPEGHYDIWKER